MGSQQHAIRSGTICSAVLAALLTVLAPTQGWADFGAPVSLSSATGGAITPQVAVDSDGDAVIVWRFTSGESRQIQLRSRSKSGALGPIQTISSPRYIAHNPQVAINSDGDALIVWLLDYRLVQARFRSKSGALSAVQNLTAPGSSGSQPRVAIDADGDALVVWSSNDGIVHARARSKTGVLSAVQTLSGKGAYGHQVAVDREGDALIVWQIRPFSNTIVQSRFRSRTGALGPIQTVADDYNNVHPQVALDADGDALVVWGKSSEVDEIQARARSKAGTYGPIDTVVSGEVKVYSSNVAIDADGDAAIVWNILQGYDLRIQGRGRLKTGTYGAIETLSAAGRNAVDADVAIDADGDGFIIWQRGTFDPAVPTRISGRTRPKAGVPGPGQTLSAGGGSAFDPQVAISANGRAVAVWSQRDGSSIRIQAAAGP